MKQQSLAKYKKILRDMDISASNKFLGSIIEAKHAKFQTTKEGILKEYQKYHQKYLKERTSLLAIIEKKEKEQANNDKKQKIL